VDLVDEVLDHQFGDVKIGDNTVFHGTDRFDVAGGLPDHLLGLTSDGQDTLLSVFVDLDGDNGGFVDADTLTFYQNKDVGCSQVDRQIFRESPKEFFKKSHALISLGYALFLFFR